MENQAFEKQNQVVNGLSVQFEVNRSNVFPQINSEKNTDLHRLQS